MRKAAPGRSRTLTIALGDTLVDWLRSKTHQGALSLGAVVRMELTKAKEAEAIATESRAREDDAPTRTHRRAQRGRRPHPEDERPTGRN